MILTSAEHLKLAKAYEKKAKDKKVSPEAREHAARWAKNHHLLSQRASALMNTQRGRIGPYPKGHWPLVSPADLLLALGRHEPSPLARVVCGSSAALRRHIVDLKRPTVRRAARNIEKVLHV